MPTYEYLCQKCGKTFEVFQYMKEAPLKICTCGQKGKVKRLVGSGAGIIFKGSGFYENDYRRRSARVDGGKAAGASAAKSDSTPAPAAPPAPAATPPSSTPPKK